jgi:hypothetical protein
MKHYLKNSILLLLPVLFFTSMQRAEDTKPEFLLVGTFHYIPDSLSCNWTATYQKLLQYKPDQIAVEEVMPTDEASQMQNYGKNYRAVWDSLTLVWVGKQINTADSIRYYQTLLNANENPKHRLQLWKYYHLNIDMGNRNFQNYLIAQHINQYVSILDTTQGWDKYFWIRYKRMITDKKDSEFFHLIYPLAVKSGITYLYPTDDRITFPIQSEAYGKFAEELDGTAAMKKLDYFWTEYKKTEAKQLRHCNAMLFINSKEWLAHTDYGQAHILDDTQSKNYKAYADVWYKRNLSIANKIIAAAKQSKAKKMAVFYGNMHIYPVKKYLEEQGYRVKLLEDI